MNSTKIIYIVKIFDWKINIYLILKLYYRNSIAKLMNMCINIHNKNKKKIVYPFGVGTLKAHIRERIASGLRKRMDNNPRREGIAKTWEQDNYRVYGNDLFTSPSIFFFFSSKLFVNKFQQCFTRFPILYTKKNLISETHCISKAQFIFWKAINVNFSMYNLKKNFEDSLKFFFLEIVFNNLL